MWTLAEGCLDTLLTVLQAALPQKLIDLSAAYNTGLQEDDPDYLVLLPPKAWVLSEQELNDVPQTPIVFILGDESAVEINSFGSYAESDIAVRIGVVIDDLRPQLMRTKVYRYSRAILEVIDDAMAGAGLGGWIPHGLAIINYAPTTASDSLFMSAAVLQWRFIKAEVR